MRPADKDVTSLSALLGRHVPLDEVKPHVVEAFRATFGRHAARPARPSTEMLDPRIERAPPRPTSAGQGDQERHRAQGRHARTARAEADWLKVKLPSGGAYQEVKKTVKEHRLSTVCEEAMCPNLAECWNAGTATIMLMGSVCTRACRFCAVDTGNPRGRLDPDEPRLAAESVFLMGLKYVVLTSVDRDDLPDGGAAHYARCVRGDQGAQPGHRRRGADARLPGRARARARVLDSGVEVYAQNVETVKRLTHPVRDPRASYEQTLDVLAYAKRARPDVLTKTSLMLGLGETDDEIIEALRDLRAIGVDIVTFGQYLRPDRRAPAGRALGARPRTSPATGGSGLASASSRSCRDRSCAAATARNGRSRRTTSVWAYNAEPVGAAPGPGACATPARSRRKRVVAAPAGYLALYVAIAVRMSAWVSSIPCQPSTFVCLPSSSL